MKLPRSLQGRLLVLVLGLVGGAWLVTATLTWIDVRHELDELLDSHLAQAAALLVVQQTGEIEDDHRVDAPTLHRYAPKVAFQVFHEGRLALRSATAPSAPMMPMGGQSLTGLSTITVDGAPWRVFAAFGAERDVQVFVGERLDTRDAILRAVLRSTLLPLVVALPLLALAAGWAVRHGLAPLRRLGGLLERRQPQSSAPLTLDDAPAEMRPMIAALNGLFERIAALVEAERRFTADAAHELRTPIAAIRTQAQVALGESDEPLRRHALQATLAGCDRATRLVEQLLMLSRLEDGEAARLAPVDLSAVVRRVLAECAPAAIAKSQEIGLEADEACVDGDATLLAALVRNLVDNAVRYSPRGAVTRVWVGRHEGGIRLSVQDSGPGLDEAALGRLGERFFRVLGSGEAGSGLGWSIVRRIVAAHGARIGARRAGEHGGLLVTVDWPPTGAGRA
jgi:two-component system sensor histidine kinase QseC